MEKERGNEAKHGELSGPLTQVLSKVCIAHILSNAHIKADEMGRVCGRSGSKSVHSTGFDGETTGNRQLGRPGHRWKEIKIDVKETRRRGGGGADWIHIHNGQTAASCEHQGRINGRVRRAADQDAKL